MVDVTGLESRDLSYRDLHWHEACFQCGKCGVSLLQQPFAATPRHILCGGCYEQVRCQTMLMMIMMMTVMMCRI